MKSVRAIGVLSVCAFGAAGCLETATYGTGESVEVGLARDIASLTTFGFVGKKEQPRISYRERGPLVIPTEDKIAAIPQPIDKLDNVDASFPGRQEELARIERRKESKEKSKIINPILGDGRNQALGIVAGNDDERETEVERLNNLTASSISPGSVSAGAELAKSREDIAKELGVPVDELPAAYNTSLIRERSILERAGLVAPRASAGASKLTDAPVHLRTVKAQPRDQQVENLISGKKEKKKKRFIFF